MSPLKNYIKQELESSLIHYGMAKGRSTSNLFEFITNIYPQEDRHMDADVAYEFIYDHNDEICDYIGEETKDLPSFGIDGALSLRNPGSMVYFIILTQMFYCVKNAFYASHAKEIKPAEVRFSPSVALLLLEVEGYKFYDFDNKYIKQSIVKEMEQLSRKIK